MLKATLGSNSKEHTVFELPNKPVCLGHDITQSFSFKFNLPPDQWGKTHLVLELLDIMSQQTSSFTYEFKVKPATELAVSRSRFAIPDSKLESPSVVSVGTALELRGKIVGLQTINDTGLMITTMKVE